MIGLVIAIKADIPNNKRTLNSMAMDNPQFLAGRWSLISNLDEIMVINMILSIPSTISKKVRVSRLIHTSPEVKSGKVIKKIWVCGLKLNINHQMTLT